MKLPAQIGHYVVEREIGRGGMGVVYSGRDTRLDRPVAVKALPIEFAADPTRLARLEREARVLASLSHPNIAALYGLEEQAGAKYLVMEMVEGETLADRLRRGPLPVDEAIQVCEHIAQGLEAAHDAGVIHRDLKPGNIKVAPDGRVKVLDFGLAKESVVRPSSSLDVTSSPTAAFTAPATVAGQIMGTPGYLSPEQARGKPLDKRTDIWSFGCVLYECLTGQMCFGGETVSDTIAAVLERDADMRKLPERTPARIRDLLARCLEKQAKNRLRDIGDARIELAQAIASRAWSTTAMQAAPDARRRLPRAALIAFAFALAAALLFRAPLVRAVNAALHPEAARPVTRTSLVLPTPMWKRVPHALSPDGAILAYVSEPSDSDTERTPPRLFLRRFDSFDAGPVPGSDGANSSPAFSPSGKWVAIVRSNTDGSRYTIAKARVDGPPEPMTKVYESADPIETAAWLTDDLLVFATAQPHFALLTVPAAGGEPSAVIDLSAVTQNYFGAHALCPLPGGKAILASVDLSDASGYHQDTVAIDIASGVMKPLLVAGSFPRFLPTGHLLYSQADTLFAAPFDPAAVKLTGAPVPVLSRLRAAKGYSADDYDVSRDGRLVYLAAAAPDSGRRLMRVDRQGAVAPLTTARADFEETTRISPDGSMVCGSAIGEDGAYQLFVCTLATGAVRILGSPGWESGYPVWMPDSQRIAYTLAGSGRPTRLMLRRADGGDTPTLLYETPEASIYVYPLCAASDGRALILGRNTKNVSTGDYLLLTLADPSRPTTLLTVPTGNALLWGRLSPDGKYFAYQSVESGRTDVYLRRAPGPDGAWPDEARVLVSTAGGDTPRWARDTNELSFIEPPASVYVTHVLEGAGLAVAPPQRLFSKLSIDAQSGLDPSPDGKWFAFIQYAEGERHITQLSVVENWFKDLRAKLEAAGAK